METLIELWQYARERKKLWLYPIMLLFVILGGLMLFAKGSMLAPFIYTLF